MGPMGSAKRQWIRSRMEDDDEPLTLILARVSVQIPVQVPVQVPV
jgi:hypothetical protein